MSIFAWGSIPLACRLQVVRLGQLGTEFREILSPVLGKDSHSVQYLAVARPHGVSVALVWSYPGRAALTTSAIHAGTTD